MAAVLFFGKHYRENNLPFYYLPVWIFISTPLIPQLACLFGLYGLFRRKADFMDRFMQGFLCLGIAAVMLIRPVLYNGWRHLYFLYVPFFWFTAAGLNRLFTISKGIIRGLINAILMTSVIWTASRIIDLHPYEYIYLNPLFQNRVGDFDRDYWRLSTTECLKQLTDREREEFSIGEINENLDNTIIGLMPEMRKKIVIQHYNTLHRNPSDYLIYNYTGLTGNEISFPLYEPINSVDRSGVKLAETFKRIPAIQPQILYTNHPETVDGDPRTQWNSNDSQNETEELLMEFSSPTKLTGLSLLPGDDEREFARSPEISISADGENWGVLPVTVSGLFDLSFPSVEEKWLRVRNIEPAEVNWSVREIYFY